MTLSSASYPNVVNNGEEKSLAGCGDEEEITPIVVGKEENRPRGDVDEEEATPQVVPGGEVFSATTTHKDEDTPFSSLDAEKETFKHVGRDPRPRKLSLRSLQIQRTEIGWRWGKLYFRPYDDDDEQDWWFASTAIPLLAATLGPLANVLSIGALVTTWRMSLVPQAGQTTAGIAQFLPELHGNGYDDPRWCYWLNVVSLITGFIGNFFLLFNFAKRIRYIIALPMTIISWYFATTILIALTISMNKYVPPTRPEETYTQGFWYAVIAAVLYLLAVIFLMINMLGYFLGHYPQHFNLTESQRTLILQTMMFFIWLAGGAGIFAQVESQYGQVNAYGKTGWSFSDALYFCDVTILTVGFGDIVPSNDIGRGLVFPYSVGGIIILGLMISSISTFAGELSKDNVIWKHADNHRKRTLERSVTSERELQERLGRRLSRNPEISAPFDARRTSVGTAILESMDKPSRNEPDVNINKPVKRTGTFIQIVPPLPRKRKRKQKAILLREEKDRFDAMRHIQESASKFKQWMALAVASIAFGILWCVGAVVFWITEHDTQDMTYFQALYFCYISLLTIGYGDFAPLSNAGRPFFVVWSLIAVPTMTVLIKSMGNTLITGFKNATSSLADFTILPKYGIWRELLDRHPWIMHWLQRRAAKHAAKKRIKEGFATGPDPNQEVEAPEVDAAEHTSTIDEVAAEEEHPISNHDRARKLALGIRRVAHDLKLGKHKRYSYEEWVQYTELIRFSAPKNPGTFLDDEQDPIEWDWIGENSPMMQNKTEPEFILDRLCESMARYIRNQDTDGGPTTLSEGTNVEDHAASTNGIEVDDTEALVSPVVDGGSPKLEI